MSVLFPLPDDEAVDLPFLGATFFFDATGFIGRATVIDGKAIGVGTAAGATARSAQEVTDGGATETGTETV